MRPRLHAALRARLRSSADRVDSPDRQADPEQLPGELGQVTARDPVTRGSVTIAAWRLGPLPSGHRGREAGGRPAVAAGTAQAMTAMLADQDRDRRQLRDLTPPGQPGRHPSSAVKS